MDNLFVRRSSFSLDRDRESTWLSTSMLVLLFFIYSSYLFVQSYFDPEGYLTSDSAHYLQLAENFLAGDGMTTTDLIPGLSGYFATWPAGYPLMIAAVAWIPGIDVFWASKIVNCLMFALCLVLLDRLFGKRAPLVALVFFISTSTEVFAYSWSEVPFIFGLIWLVYAIERYVTTDRLVFVWHLLLAGLFLFLARYIGLIGAGIVGLVGFYFLSERQWKQMLLCWIAGSIPIVFAGVYLWKNYRETGQPTGMERIPRPETVQEFWEMFWRGFVAEFNVLTTSSVVFLSYSIVLLVASVLLFVRWRHVRALFSVDREEMLIPFLFFFVGGIYFVAVVYMRWSSQFDPFNFRLLGPATMMFWLGIASWIAQLDGSGWVRWRNALVLLFGVTFYVTVIYDSYNLMLSPSQNYKETREQVLETYEEIPEGSIVAFETVHARYLRTDLQYVKVHFQPYFKEKETVDEFLERVTPNHAAGVYVEVKPLSDVRFHESFVRLMEEHKGERFVRLE
ncbi:hypothetical protein [Aquibacillus albus]|uniref:Glycosyltransferase RgtA/B/C/D-like domain-containing protein n=1 Tax=Aquibacillus albus TaxID=1168171 RepID=A0ABS2MZQ1_9BACI|nr:hypothetical protein [Aquibacillus albus]MBM7571357.1 hypothetical protein [Aquibacillus albus]